MSRGWSRTSTAQCVSVPPGCLRGLTVHIRDEGNLLLPFGRATLRVFLCHGSLRGRACFVLSAHMGPRCSDQEYDKCGLIIRLAWTRSNPGTACCAGVAQLPATQVVYYRMRRCISHPPGAVFQARLLDKREGVNTERHVFGKLSARRFQGRPFWYRRYSNGEDIDHGKSA